MEKIVKTSFVFQTDSDIVNQVYKENDNYIIEYNETGDKNYCAIYFSSNDIYYPNNEEIFKKRIIDKNFFEWYNTRIEKAYKHIFVRDIFKQWYLSGINSKIDSQEKLFDFLKKETYGYNIINVGSSAGGYAAILYGSLLKAEKVLAFNPQYEINSLLVRSTEAINPLVFRLKNICSNHFDLKNIDFNNTIVFYFMSCNSKWDIEQNIHIGDKDNIYKIGFNTSHHGIPFLKIALPRVINLSKDKLIGFSKKNHNPFVFTIRMVGLIKTLNGFIRQIYLAYKKRKI